MLALAPLETGLSPRRQQIRLGQLSRNGELVGTEKRQFIIIIYLSCPGYDFKLRPGIPVPTSSFG